MDRRSFITTAGAAALAPAIFNSRAFAQTALPYDAIAALRAEGLTEASSQVMQTASYLMDVLGPRLTSSPGVRRSAEWVVSKMKEWGISGASLEPWPTDPTGTNNGFPRGWSNSKFYLQAVSPTSFPITGMSLGWTPGTTGLVRGEAVLVTETTEAVLKEKWSGKLRGKWVLGQPPLVVRSQWDPVARRYTQQDLADMESPPRGPEYGTAQPGAMPPEIAAMIAQRAAQQPAPPGPPPFDRNKWFQQEGALGVFSTGRGQGVVGVQGGPRTDPPEQLIPRIAIVAEHYGRLARSLITGQTIVIEADIRNDWQPNPDMFNVVGEIKGSELPNEVVIIGGHFDSWPAATGATDNGGACCTALEAMRMLKATKVKLKRTVRVCLWTGEEQGLIGSRLYVANHFGGVRGAPTKADPRGDVQPVTRDHSRFQAYFNLDNGVGAIRGIYAQSNPAVAPIFRQWMEPFRDLGMTTINPRNTGSTDHISFDNAGLPGFQFIQDPLDYETKTHHTNMDFFESLQPEDMRRNSTILAAFAMLAANNPTQLPRKPRPAPPPSR